MKVAMFAGLIVSVVATAFCGGYWTVSALPQFAASKAYFANGRRPEFVAGVRCDGIAFRRAFFSGFVKYDGAIGSDCPASEAGFAAGRAYRNAFPGEIETTMRGFGYAPAHDEGIRVRDQRHVHALRIDARPGEVWWIDFMGGSAAARDWSRLECARMRVHGYLSPRGSHGHMGAFRREFIAERVECP